MKNIFITVTLILAAAASLRAAVGCDLNDPDRDVKRLFPDSTGYKTSYRTLSGASQLADVEAKLGDKFTGLYETVDVPYTVYEIRRGTKPLGYLHGVNQKGTYGGIQVFLAFNPGGDVRGFYIQKLSSRAAAKLRSPGFARRFEGLTLKDFAGYDASTGKAEGATARIMNPAPEAPQDFRAILRAVKKNLALMDEFVFRGDKP